jgi:hypothetical protein
LNRRSGADGFFVYLEALGRIDCDFRPRRLEVQRSGEGGLAQRYE